MTQGELQDFLAFSHSDFPRNRLEATRALANFLENGTHHLVMRGGTNLSLYSEKIQQKFWVDGPNGIEILLGLAQDETEQLPTRVEAIRCIANFGFHGIPKTIFKKKNQIIDLVRIFSIPENNRKAFLEKYGLGIFMKLRETDNCLIRGEINRLFNIFGAHGKTSTSQYTLLTLRRALDTLHFQRPSMPARQNGIRILALDGGYIGNIVID